MPKDGCSMLYLFERGEALCLHDLFARDLVGVFTRTRDWRGVRYFIYRYRPDKSSAAWKRGWWRNGVRARLVGKDEILLANELADKYGVEKIL